MTALTVYRCDLDEVEPGDQINLYQRWFDVGGVRVDGDEVELTLIVRYRRGHTATVLPGHAHNGRIQADRIAQMQEQLDEQPTRKLEPMAPIDLSGHTVDPDVDWVHWSNGDEWFVADAIDGTVVATGRKLADRDFELARLGGTRQEIFPFRKAASA